MVMRLYKWDGVLIQWQDGSVIAVAESEEQARDLAMAELRAVERSRNPFVKELPDSDAVWIHPYVVGRAEMLVSTPYVRGSYYEDIAIVRGPPTAVFDLPCALCFDGSA